MSYFQSEWVYWQFEYTIISPTTVCIVHFWKFCQRFNSCLHQDIWINIMEQWQCCYDIKEHQFQKKCNLLVLEFLLPFIWNMKIVKFICFFLHFWCCKWKLALQSASVISFGTEKNQMSPCSYVVGDVQQFSRSTLHTHGLIRYVILL